MICGRFIYNKITDIYLARTMNKTCGGQIVVRGEVIDFLDLEERLWWQVHSIFRNSAKLYSLTSCPDMLLVEVGHLLQPAGGQLERTVQLRVPYSSTVGQLIDQAARSLNLPPGTTYVLLRFNTNRQRPRPGPFAHRHRLVDSGIDEDETLCLCTPAQSLAVTRLWT
jgi:hypothetical protein|eukprot:COSAG01_NODE_323_length_18848_cov_144.375273_9_plen_167_part_00